MSTVTTTGSVIPSNPKDQEAILDAIKEADASLIRIDSEKDQIKAIIEEIHEKYELNKGLVRKMIRLYHSQSLNKFEQEATDVIDAYTTIVKA